MRRHTTASSARPGGRPGGIRGLFGIGCLSILGLVAFAASGVPSAGAVADACPNAAIRAEQGSSYLSDCRAYEVVSPLDKNGAPVENMLPAASDGNSLIYTKITPSADSLGSQVTVPTVARRTAAGWALADATLKNYVTDPDQQMIITRQSYPRVADPGFHRMILNSNSQLDPSASYAVETGDRLFDADLDTRTASRIDAAEGNVEPPLPQGEFSYFVGASTSLDTVVFLSNNPRLPAAPPNGSNSIYRRTANGLQLVSVFPDGTPIKSGSSVAVPRDWGAAAISAGLWTHRVSEDGQRVFFYVGFGSAGASDPGRGELFLRDGDSRTLAISASQRSGEVGERKPATFMGASPSGDVVFFWSSQPLTDGVPGGGVYRYRLQAGPVGELTRITGDPGPEGLGMSIAEGATVPSFQLSDDGSSLYFIAKAALAPGAVDGQPNAYVWRNEELKLVRSLAAGATVQRVSRDGRYAVFQTTAAVDGAPTAGYRALYLYDADAATFACASCRPDGSASKGDSMLDKPIYEEGSRLGGAIPRGIANDGRLYFDSEDRIVPADSSNAMDVYVYEGGAPHLLTSGNAGGSYLLDNSDDGDTAFIATADRRARRDTDDQYDLYAVRVGGGFAEPPPAGSCAGEACQGSLSPPPAAVRPGSSLFSAAGFRTPGPSRHRTNPKVGVAPLSAADRATLAAGGKADLKGTVSGAGTVTVTGMARLAGRSRQVLRASVRARRAGTVTVPLRLSRSAVAAVSRGGSLKVHLTVRFGAAQAKSAITLKAAGANSGAHR